MVHYSNNSYLEMCPVFHQNPQIVKIRKIKRGIHEQKDWTICWCCCSTAKAFYRQGAANYFSLTVKQKNSAVFLHSWGHVKIVRVCSTLLYTTVLLPQESYQNGGNLSHHHEKIHLCLCVCSSESPIQENPYFDILYLF